MCVYVIVEIKTDFWARKIIEYLFANGTIIIIDQQFIKLRIFKLMEQNNI